MPSCVLNEMKYFTKSFGFSLLISSGDKLPIWCSGSDSSATFFIATSIQSLTYFFSYNSILYWTTDTVLWAICSSYFKASKSVFFTYNAKSSLNFSIYFFVAAIPRAEIPVLEDCCDYFSKRSFASPAIVRRLKISCPRFLEPNKPLGYLCLGSFEASVSSLKVKKLILAFRSFLCSSSSGFVGVGPDA
jgi:hypothetical protein